MTSALIVAEHDGAALAPSTAKCVACAAALGGAVDVAVLASGAPEIAEAAARIAGVRKVVRVDDERNRRPLAAVLAPQIAALADEHTHVLAPSTTFGKDVLPRVAAMLGVPQISDVMAVETPYRFRRPVYAGNAVLTVEAPAERKVVATVRVASFAAPPEAAEPAPIETRALDVAVPAHTRFVERKSASGERPDLQTAARVVAGGRALGSVEGFELVHELADALGAAVGASRAAVDSGFAPNELQVGQTGKIIAPELYIAVGISGAIQHLTGIKDAGTIVAINKDPEAPIFEVADVGLVADLFEALPKLLDALKANG
ncbi:MAG TPA: FAD-binding protein [Gammaproteobacteria bacterium]